MKNVFIFPEYGLLANLFEHDNETLGCTGMKCGQTFDKMATISFTTRFLTYYYYYFLLFCFSCLFSFHMLCLLALVICVFYFAVYLTGNLAADPTC
jgi:hypothetical protein